MPSSKQLVFLPSICSDSFLLWSKLAGSVYLRDYREQRELVVHKTTVEEATSLLDQDGAVAEEVAVFNNIRKEEVMFWESMIMLRNIKHGHAPFEGETKLQAAFKAQCLDLLAAKKTQELRAVIEWWISNCETVTEKDRFNRFDDEDPAPPFDNETGVGWQSQLLINSRVNASSSWIETGSELTDFSMAAMELSFTVSARPGVNPFVPEKQSRVIPDGLGIRRNGFFTVLEVKGPQDEADLLGPVLQAACAATAVVAKGDMLSEIARSKRVKRPAYENAKVPKRSSIGLHVLTSKNKTKSTLEPWSDEVENCCRILLTAFAQLEYIAFSFVVPDETNQFRTLILSLIHI